MYVDDLVSGCHLVRLTAQTLTVFLSVVLSRRYTNPSSEIITVLAGLDEVDACFLDFVDAIENAIRSDGSGKSWHCAKQGSNLTNSVKDEIRQKAVDVGIALTAGAYQTSLVSYFTHRDLFPGLIKVGDSW